MTTRTVASSTHAGSAGLAATINGCMFVFGVVLLLMGSLLPTLDVDVAKAGSLGAFPLAGILVATVIIGPVLDKTSAKASLVVSLLLIIVALVVMPSLGGFAALATVAFVYGLGAGVLNASTNILIATLNASGRGSALNLLGLFFSLGALSTPLLMAVTRGFMSPASVLYLLAAVCSLVLLLVLWQRFPPPLRASTPLRGLLRVLRNRAVWLFAALLFFESLEENCMFVWAGKVTDELLQMPVSHAEIPLLGLTAGMGFGRFVASRLLARLRSRTVILNAGALVALGSVVVLASGSSYPWMVAGFTLVGLGLSAIYPTALGLAGDRFPQETGTVFGAIIAISLVGGTLGPVAGGLAAAIHPRLVMIIPLIAVSAIALLSLGATRQPASPHGAGAPADPG